MNKVSKTNKKVVVVDSNSLDDPTSPSSTGIKSYLKSEYNATFVKYIRSMETERLIYSDSELQSLEYRNNMLL